MKKGFTLVELVIVIVIVAILSIVGVREYQYQAEKARATEAVANIRTIADAKIAYYLEHNVWCEDIRLLPITLEGKQWTYSSRSIVIRNNKFAYACKTGNANTVLAIAYRFKRNNQSTPSYNFSFRFREEQGFDLNTKRYILGGAIYTSQSTDLDKRIINHFIKDKSLIGTNP